MLEPTWNPIAMPGARLTGDRRRVRIFRRAAEADAPNEGWLVCAAPFSVAALWIAATGASFLFWSITGRREPLDWCRSGNVLTVGATLAALGTLVASLLKGVAEGPYRFVSEGRRPHPDLPAWEAQGQPRWDSLDLMTDY